MTSVTDEQKAAIKAKLEAREEHIRESWVKAMEARLMRDELEKCHRSEGVNHYENCKWLVDKYLVMLKENKVHGYKHIDTM
ncbi:NADH-ubiquinone oxidoreductase 12 kDa subunit [Armillaria luteobubalina]|uniref:NADH-ubiquinone oxidoreductase 12 kDa subunit n=1 Tax=Armillaria luteobubalina TaxID=153913 RepID=A0AA39Q5Q7_9AGAR|nr:NADH-ubiquinone oxidoreductase 12 kDa subunit [Armillaria luteobubalina]